MFERMRSQVLSSSLLMILLLNVLNWKWNILYIKRVYPVYEGDTFLYYWHTIGVIDRIMALL